MVTDIDSRHAWQHDLKHPCEVESCGLRFQCNKDLARHMKAKHPETIESLTLYYCPHVGCKHSVGRGNGNTRKDNMVRHIRTKHEGQGEVIVYGNDSR